MPSSLLKILLASTFMLTAAACSDHADKEARQMSQPADPMSKLDADMKAVLDAQASLNPKPIETLSAADARKQPSPADGVKKILQAQGKNANDAMGVKTKDVTYPTAGGTQPARVYIPEHKGKKPLPVVVYYHGGGFVIADLDTYDSSPRAIAKMADAIVVSVEYRHAPENKFPAAHDDAFAAYRWVLKNARKWGGDPKRVAVMGESAGGNLAINTAIAARDNHVQMPLYQVLVYPIAGVDMNTPSYQENANAKPLNKPMMAWFMQNSIKSDADKQDSRLDLVGKANLQGLPATTIIMAEIDPLRSDSELLADKLKAAGVNVDSKGYRGVTHEFFGMGAVVADAKDAESVAASDLKAAFANVPHVKHKKK